jgi:hypothetical protein
MKEIFTIGTVSGQCYGHGDYGLETRIHRIGPYGTGGFPPCFYTRTEAEQYLADLTWKSDKVVVALRLYSNTAITSADEATYPERDCSAAGRDE